MGPRVVRVDVADVAREFPIETGRVVFQRPLTATRSGEGGSGLLNQRQCFEHSQSGGSASTGPLAHVLKTLGTLGTIGTAPWGPQ